MVTTIKEHIIVLCQKIIILLLALCHSILDKNYNTTLCRLVTNQTLICIVTNGSAAEVNSVVTLMSSSLNCSGAAYKQVARA